MYVKLTLAIPHEMFQRLEAAAHLCAQPTTTFAKEIIEADLAGRTLHTVPAIPKRPGGKRDIFERLK